MKLFLKQRVFSWGDKFTVYDESGNDRFYVKGEVFSFGKKLHIFDLSGEEIAYIEQKMFSFLPKYYISVAGSQIAEVVKHFTFLRQKYSVNGLGWSVEGDFFAHDYTVTAGAETVACVSKQWFTFGDAYGIEISNPSNELTALCVVLVIDACLAAASAST